MNASKLRLMACCLVVAWSAPVAVYADTYTAYDNYWGGGVTSPSDSIQVPSGSDVLSAQGQESNYAVDTLTVTRGSDYFNAQLAGTYFSSNVSEFVGDLFLTNTGWHPYSTGPNDTHYAVSTNALDSTTWNYVLSIVDDKGNPVRITPGGSVPTDGKIVLYSTADGGKIVTTSDKDQVTQTTGYRADQNLFYTPADPNNPLATALAMGGWMLDPATGTFTFSLNDFLNNNTMASLGLDGELGLHWTMSCGNDVIEGVVPASGSAAVPEPATMLLFGVGLSGLAAYRSRRKK